MSILHIFRSCLNKLLRNKLAAWAGQTAPPAGHTGEHSRAPELCQSRHRLYAQPLRTARARLATVLEILELDLRDGFTSVLCQMSFHIRATTWPLLLLCEVDRLKVGLNLQMFQLKLNKHEQKGPIETWKYLHFISVFLSKKNPDKTCPCSGAAPGAETGAPSAGHLPSLLLTEPNRG